MTFSLVGFDDDHMGVATASHWVAVGGIVCWAQAGVGVVATQAFTQTGFGPDGLAGLRAGAPALEVANKLLHRDPLPHLRQLAVLDNHGDIADHTGSRCLPEVTVTRHDNAVALGNMLASRTVTEDMIQAWRATDGPLADRLIASLAAGDASGGDVRGRQAAAVLVVERTHTGPDAGVVCDLRVDDHADPINALRELRRIHTAADALGRVTHPATLGRGPGYEADGREATIVNLSETGGAVREEADLWLAVLRLIDDDEDAARVALGHDPALFTIAKRWAEVLKQAPS